MANIIGIPTTRVSDQFVQRRMLQQVQYDLRELFRLESQLSTGRKFELPGEEPVAALRVMSLQRLLEQKEQVRSNLETTQSYLTATDVAMSQISELVAEIRGVAVAMMNEATVDDDQRTAAVQQVQEAVSDAPPSLTVAVMGCVVNGPGEAKDADVGVAGGRGFGYLFRKGELVRKVPADRLAAELAAEIRRIVSE